ncbi:MAG: hypothetical protein EXR71_09365 [Myxococcales bacterium]|nr:hypothetical protein [Myxococcales bacterium]
MRHVRRWPRLLLVLSAAVWMFVGSVAQFHHATVAHVVCPEHGETIDVRTAEPASATAAVSAAPGGVADHEACALPSALPSAVATERAVATSTEAADTAYVSPGAVDARLPAPLGYAPKTSPPGLG